MSWEAVGIVGAVIEALGLAALVGGWKVCELYEGAWRRAEKGAKRTFLAACVLATGYAGGKHIIGRVTYESADPGQRYIFDAGSYVTNDYVHVAFTRSAVVPASAALYGCYRACGTNETEWTEFIATTFAEFQTPTNIPFAGAITNDFLFYTTYTPGPVVHTNGVAVILWQRGGVSNAVATIRTGVYADAERVAPNAAITNGPATAATVNLTISGESEDE